MALGFFHFPIPTIFMLYMCQVHRIIHLVRPQILSLMDTVVIKSCLVFDKENEPLINNYKRKLPAMVSLSWDRGQGP